MNRRGLTMLELILTITAGAAISLIAYILINPVDNVLVTTLRRGGVTEAQAAMTRMLAEIERVKEPALISTMTSSYLAFTDVDDQAVDFQLSGTDLLRGSDVLARNVSALTFQYLDENGAVTAVADDVRVIRISVTITSGNQTINLQSAAGIRNGLT